ncbi:MAG: TIGR00296 family protein [Candidatus Hydrothermarchaeota archaeon]
MFSLEEGEMLISIAREAMETYVRERRILKPERVPEKFLEKRGVFVTIETFPDFSLRGCIGYPEPALPLIKALIDSAINASTRDPRFPPVTERELDKLVVEVSVLTKPELLDCPPNEYANNIKIGEHGLIVERIPYRGLLLPQVPVEWEWNEEEFLSQTCIKAGLPLDAWLDRETKIYRFSAQIFTEKSPRGEVVEKTLKEGC